MDHPDMLNSVAPENYSGPRPSDLVIGLIGRGNRDQDAYDGRIVHIEDKRFKGEGRAFLKTQVNSPLANL